MCKTSQSVSRERRATQNPKKPPPNTLSGVFGVVAFALFLDEGRSVFVCPSNRAERRRYCRDIYFAIYLNVEAAFSHGVISVRVAIANLVTLGLTTCPRGACDSVSVHLAASGVVGLYGISGSKDGSVRRDDLSFIYGLTHADRGRTRQKLSAQLLASVAKLCAEVFKFEWMRKPSFHTRTVELLPIIFSCCNVAG